MSAERKITVARHEGPTRCPYCHDPIEDDTPVAALLVATCDACGARFHGVCAGEHGCCTTFGCKGNVSLGGTTVVTITETAESRQPDPTLVAAAVVAAAHMLNRGHATRSGGYDEITWRRGAFANAVLSLLVLLLVVEPRSMLVMLVAFAFVILWRVILPGLRR